MLGGSWSVIGVVVARGDVIELLKVMWISRRFLVMCVGVNIWFMQ